LDSSRIFTLISSGKTETATRGVDTCISQGGLCRVCIAASNPEIVAPAVGLHFQVQPKVILDCNQFIIYTGGSTLELPYSSSLYDQLEVFVGGVLLDSSTYVVSDTTFTLNTPTVADTVFVFKYLVKSLTPYFYWIADTYAGSLLGVKSFRKPYLPVRKELMLSVVPKEDVRYLVDVLQRSIIGDEDTVQYLISTKDELEQAIFAVLLTAIFLN